MSLIGDVTMGAMEYALDGLAARSAARAHNVANMNTPGFQGQTVSFESALAAALSDGDLSDVTAPATVEQPGEPDALGNTVRLEDELVGGIKDNLLFQALVQGYTYKLDALRIAITGRMP